MYQPSLDAVKKLTRHGNLIPVYRDVPADLETPVSAYLKVAQPPYSFLLESAEGGERQARYSFIGTEPYRVLKTGPGQPDGMVDPLVLIQEELDQFKLIPQPTLPRFHGGAVGYLAYDTVRYFEPKVPSPQNDPLGLPESLFMFTDTLLVFDHTRHQIKVISHVRLDGNLEASYAQAIEKIDNLVNRLSKPLVPPSEDQGHPSTSTPEVFSNLTQKEYEKIVIRAKEYIVAGDIIQVVPARRLSQPTSANPFMIYRTMRTINPSPYMYYLHLEDFHIIGASPEALVRVEDGIVYNFPLAGTYRRGATPEEDEALAIALRADEKERAEHIMLVDLGRNDVGRVAEPGSVQVTDLMRVVRYSHVMHMESEIQGKLHSNSTMYDALRSCLPAGTLSGAPKIRAMEIIAELEREKRGPYGGAVGYFGFQGNMDTAIPIRTIVLKDQIAHVHSGGGVVYDSVPSLEFQETTNKAMAPLQAINKAEGRE